MTATEIAVAVVLAVVMAVVVAVLLERAKVAAARPYMEQMSRAITGLMTPPTMFTTKLVLQTGETVGVESGWTPGRKPGEVVTLLSKRYEVVEVRDPELASDESEATLVLRPLA